jgi:hypothetical protein
MASVWRLQGLLQAQHTGGVCFYIFSLPVTNGEDLTKESDSIRMPSNELYLWLSKAWLQGYQEGIERPHDRHWISYNHPSSRPEIDTRENEAHLQQRHIASIDAESMYPSIKYKLIEQAITYYANTIEDDEAHINIHIGLDMIKFGMKNTILLFIDKYYKYDGNLKMNEKGLTIGGYELAWLADLAMSYLLDKMNERNPLTNSSTSESIKMMVLVSLKETTKSNNWLSGSTSSNPR